MLEGPVIQHWLVAVAKAAGMEGTDDLQVASVTASEAAWDLVAMAAGVTQDNLAAAVAAHYGLPVADLAAADPYACRLLPGRIARKLNVLPLRYSDRGIWVATADPLSLEAEREISHVAGRHIHFEVAPPGPLSTAVALAYPEHEPPHEIPPLDLAARGGPKVLVVDDDADTRVLLRSVLESSGFRVVEATNGKEALDALSSGSEPYSLVTLDLDMPVMTGLEALKSMREGVSTANIPVVVATGYDDPQLEMDLFTAGADDFVVKPLDPPRFLLRVQAVLRRYGVDTSPR
ncbi:MAG: response regulator [Gemmatimonadota bacterium]